jgi:peptide/nickel transport system substrate-binding protein
LIRRTAIWVAVLGMLTLGTAAWTANPGASRTPARARTSVITLEGNTGVTFTKNFNPFDTASFVSSMSVRSLSYEPLIEFNVLGSQIHPWLATKWSFGSGGKSLTFTLRKGVKWSDGKAFTSKDVAFTFNLIRKNAAANYSGIPPMSKAPTTSGNYKVTLHFSEAVYTDLPAIGGNTYMVAQHIWKSVKQPATATISKPIGTGPYVLKSYTSQLVKYTANRNYWGGRPPISQVDVPSYSSNSAASNALSSGQLTWAGNDIPNIKSVFVNRNPKTNHYFFAPGSTVTLFFNVANGGPLANPLVREAISYGINRHKLSVIGETGYEKPATSSSGLIIPNQKQYLVKSDTKDLPSTPNKSKVASLMRKAGYSKDSHGIWAKNGKEVSFSIEDPTAYSDYYEDSQLICQEMHAVGIGCTPDGVATSAWYTDLPNGHFQAAIHWGSGGVSPFVQYQNWMDYTLSASLGKAATADYGRYHNATAQHELKVMEGTNPSNQKAITNAVHKLASLFSKQVPDAPLLYGADWDEYSTAHFTGFVTPSNPYMDPSPGDPQLPYILMHLKVKK